MKVLVASKSGNCLGLSQRIGKEGHIPYFLPLDKRSGSIGEGIAKKNKNGGYDLTIFDTSSYGKYADSFTCPVVGACRWADHADTNDIYGQQLLTLAKIKPCLDFPPNSVVVDCQMWWDGFASHFHSITMTEDRLMNGDIGPIVPYAGVTMKMVSKDSRIMRETVGKMEDLLKKTSYRGPITIRVSATKEALYAMKLFVKVDLLPTFAELYKGSLTRLFHGIAIGSNGYADFMNDYALSVLVTVPPYPHICLRNAPLPAQIEGLNEQNLKHIWLHDVKKEENKYYVAGSNGRVMTVVARGRDIIECRRRVYRTLSNITLPFMQYRTDIGWKFEDDEKLLRRWGFI